MNTAASNRRKALYLGTALATTLVSAGVCVTPALADPPPNPNDFPHWSDNGGATIVTDNSAKTVTVNLDNSSRVITWTDFDVGQNATVTFTDATAAVAVLNRINNASTQASRIYGTVASEPNIALFLQDVHGIIVGPSGVFKGVSALNGGSIVLTSAVVKAAGGVAVDGLNVDGLRTGFTLDGSTTSGQINLISSASNKGLFSSGNIIIASPDILAAGKIQAAGNVALVAGQDINFSGGIGSPLSFTIDAGTTLNGVAISSTAAISAGSAVLAAVTVTPASAMSSLLNVASGATITATSVNGAVVLATADYTGGGISVGVAEHGDGINVDGTVKATGTGGDVVLRADGGVSGGGVLDAKGTLDIASNTGGIALSGAITAGAGATLSATDATNGVVAVGDLTASAGDVQLTGHSIELDNASIEATTGNLTLTGPVKLTTDTANTLSGANISIGAVDAQAVGEGDLSLTATGATGSTTITGAIGAGTRIKSLTTTGTTDINGGTVTTDEVQTYNHAVLLSADTTLTSNGNQDITFGSTVDGTADNAYFLKVNTGGVTHFGGQVGGTARLTTLDTNTGGTTEIDGGLVRTSGNQTYADNIKLLDDTALISTASGNISLQKVNAATAGSQSLVIQTGGTVSINEVGTTKALAKFGVDALALSLTNPAIDVGTLALDLDNGDINLSFANDLTIGSVSVDPAGALGPYTVAGLNAANGNVTINYRGKTLKVQADVKAGNGDVTLSAGSVSLGIAGSPVLLQSVKAISVTATAASISSPSTAGVVKFDSNTSGSGDENGRVYLNASGPIALLPTSVIDTHGAYARVKSGNDIALGDVTAKGLFNIVAPTTQLDVTGDFTAHDLKLNDAFLANVTGDFRAASILINPPHGIANAITLNVGGDVTGNHVTPATTGNSDNNYDRLKLTADNITVNGNHLVQLGAVTAVNTLAITGGNSTLPTPTNGSLDITSATVSDGNLALTAYSTSSSNAARDGDILLGFGNAGSLAYPTATATLDNTSGTKGNIQISDALVATSNVILKSANDIRIAQYHTDIDGMAGVGNGTGFVSSANGSITATAGGSVYAIDTVAPDTALNDALTATARGISSLSSSGNLTVSSEFPTGDVRLGSIHADGDLLLNIGGSLTGLAGASGPFTPIGGALLAVNGGIMVTTSTVNPTPATPDHVISLDTITAKTVSLTTNLVLVNNLTSSTAAPVYNGSAYYVNNFDLGATTTYAVPDPDGTLDTVINLVATDGSGIDRLDDAFQSVALSAGGSIKTVVPIVKGAQLGKVQAGNEINIEAAAITAGDVSSDHSYVSMRATAGTLSLLSATAGTFVFLTKQGGAALVPADGDELRVRYVETGIDNGGPDTKGGATFSSSTHVRTDYVKTDGDAITPGTPGTISITAGNDVTGTKYPILPSSLIGAYGQSLLSAGGIESDISISSLGLVQLFNAYAGRDVTVTAGSATRDGAIDIVYASGHDLKLTASSTDPSVPGEYNGNISLSDGFASGSATLDNRTGGNSGDIIIGDRIEAYTGIGLKAADDVNLHSYSFVGGDNHGILLTHNNGITIDANGSVYTNSESVLGASARGIDTLTGNSVTVNATRDARIGLIDLTGNLTMAIGGSLTGTSAGTRAADGANLWANGFGGTITVHAGLKPTTSVAEFNHVWASGDVNISATQIAANVIESNFGSVTLTGALYAGQINLNSSGAASLYLSDVDGDGLVTTTLPYTADEAGNPLAAGFGKTTIDVGGTITTSTPIGDVAQLGNVTAGGLIDVDARAITADAVVSTNAFIDLLAKNGTLSLDSATAKTNVTLTKTNTVQPGTLALVNGDELRVTTVTAGSSGTSGTITLDSYTHTRVNTATAYGNLTIKATTGDVTGMAGGSGTRTDGAFARAVLTANGAASDLGVTAGGLVQLGDNNLAGHDFTAIAGTATLDGAIDITTATAGHNLALTAIANSPAAPATRDGDILLGTGVATSGMVTIKNDGGNIGDIEIGHYVTASTGIDFKAADDVKLAQFTGTTASPTDGYLDSTTGALAITARGSVYTTDANHLEADRRGIDLINGTNVTISSAGDVRLDSITVDGNLAFNVVGSLTGRGGTGGGSGSTTVNGGALFAHGGDVTVDAGASGATVGNDIISLDRIVASGNVTLAADELALHSIDAGGNVGLTGAYYIGRVTIGNGTITLGDGDANGTDAFGANLLLYTPNEVTAPLAANFGKATVTALNGSVTGSAGMVAQFGNVTARSVNFTAKAITGDTVTATAAGVTLLANAGTLAIGTADAATDLTLTKTNGLLSQAGNELRLGTGHAGEPAAGNALLDSATNIRAGTIDAKGNVTLTAHLGDATGLKGAAPATDGNADTQYLRANLTASGTVADVAVTTAGLAQLGPVLAGRNIGVTAGDATHNGAIDISTATAIAGNLTLTATAANPLTDSIHTGDIVLDTGVAGALARLSNVVGGGSIGRIDVKTSLTAGTDVIVDSATAAQLAPVVATAGTIAVRARTGSVGGYISGEGATLTAGEDIAVTAGTSALIASAKAGDDIVLTAAGTLGVTGTLEATGLGPDTRAVLFADPANVTFGTETIPGASIVLTGNGVTLGDQATAAGNVSIAGGPSAATVGIKAGGYVNVGAGTVGVGAVVAGSSVSLIAGSGALTAASVDAGGPVTLTGATTVAVAGPTKSSSDVTVNAPGAVTLGAVNGRNVSLTGATVGAGATKATADLTVKSTTGALSLASGIAGGTAMLTAATNATVTGELTASGDVTVTAPGTVALGDVNGRNVSLTGGTVNAGATTATAALVAKSTTGSLTLASGKAGGAATLTSATTATVTGALTAAGDLTVTAPGAVALGKVSGSNVSLTGGTVNAGATDATGALTAKSTTGALTLASGSAGGTATLTGATTATVTGALTAGSDVTVTAPGAVSLGSLGGRAISVTGGTVNAGGTTASGPLAVTSTTGALTLGATTAGGAVNLTSATRATLGSIGAGSQTVTLTATDADVNGAINAGTIKVVDRATGDNPLVLGDGTTATGFNLSQDEVNRLNAATVTLDPGTALATPQNLRIGTLAVDGDTGSTTLNLLGTHRIDITGTLGATGTRSIIIGGNGSATTDAANAATVLRVAAGATGGGRLIMPGVSLTLRGNSIGVGQDAAFLDALGLNVGGTPLASTAVATDYVGNTFSSLYTAIRGGAAYTDQVLVSAGTLTVRYSNFALFQNTGVVAANSGAVLQGSGATALDIRGLGTTPGGPFAFFGTINGITNQAAAVLGEPTIAFTSAPSIDRSAARINGCLIGSGSACIGLNINPAQLPGLDPIRDQLIDRPEGLEIPFDPLVGTNNESLFGDVGSFGLSDVPLDLIQCKKSADGKCETPAEGAN